ncbi:Ig-like domain-containing protein [Gillisia sp. M10.2A]|uniref:Ig-like domain-containing protein n=1 Tax=Gillisia lutea TaxID=2909668 RepID=A0ABS9EEE3_9FLAO|nr:LamG-like jellyroll fold domain-containing protein [Gillisia lutea]MCF4100259.1 Ig-like domain-containing protein [Gillisia lutea]
MKKLNIPFIGFIMLFLTLSSCEDGIDGITQVDPGPDGANPQITIISPQEGSTIQDLNVVSSVNIKFQVVDDIEIASITVAVDGTDIATFNDFKDYRIAKEEMTYGNISSGDHTLVITATDIVGNTSTSMVNFSKAPPYSPMFGGEFFYMPFDGNYVELVSVTDASEVGTPGFAGTSYVGTNAYKGAEGAYLTFPIEEENLGNNFSAAFWYKVNASPDRAGILVVGNNADDRNQGFRLFREGNGAEQRIKLNVGTGTGESWNDGGVIDVAAGEWVHIAFTISENQSIIYLNGIPVNTSDLSKPIDWTGTGNITIGAGGETFSYWNHLSDLSALDEVRLFNTTLSPTEIQNMIDVFTPYEPKYAGETFYMPFNGSNAEFIENRQAEVVGSPDFTDDAVMGKAYEGAADSYLTLPTEGLLGEEFSAAFWYKVNASPDRAGLLTVSPEDLDNAGYPDVQNIRTSGFRLFREGNATEQRIKLNVGTGDAESWNDGGVVDVTAGEWVHVAFTISAAESNIYLNGVKVNTSSLSKPVNWTGTDLLSIMSGAPRFTEWGHKADSSLMDELRLFNKALSAAEIQAIMNE